MVRSEPTVPPLFKEAAKRLKEPLDMIEELSNMNVFTSDRSLSDQFYKPKLPKIVVLDEACDGMRVVNVLLGLSLPPGVEVPIVLNFKNDRTVLSKKISINFRCPETSSFLVENVSEKDLVNVILREMKSDSDQVVEEEEDIEQKTQEKMENQVETLSHIEDEEAKKKKEKVERCIVDIVITVVHPLVGDFTVICLPEILQEHGKVEDKQHIKRLQGYIQRYVEDLRCVFLNLLSCSSEMYTSVSNSVLEGLDLQGTRIIRVFRDLGLSSDYMISQLTSMTINNPNCKRNPSRFGYFFIGDDYETSKEETSANRYSIIKSRLGEDCFGFEQISKYITLVLLSMIISPTSELLKRVELDLEISEIEIETTRQKFISLTDAIPTIATIVNSATSSLVKLFVVQDYKEYRHNRNMYAASEVAFRFASFRDHMMSVKKWEEELMMFDEINLVSETHKPEEDYVPCTVSKSLFAKRFSRATATLEECVSRILTYVEWVVINVLTDHSKEHQQLYPYIRNIGKLWVDELQKEFRKKLNELIKLETSFIYTCKKEYYEKVVEMKNIKLMVPEEKPIDPVFVNIDGIKEKIRVDNMTGYPHDLLDRAFDLRKRMSIYWGFAIDRLIDNCMLNFQVIINDMLVKGIQTTVHKELSEGNFVLHSMEPKISYNEATLKHRIAYLKSVKKQIKNWECDCAFLFWLPPFEPMFR